MYRILVYYAKNGKINRFLKSKREGNENPVVDFSLSEVTAEIEELLTVGVGMTSLFPRKNALQINPSQILKIEILAKGEPVI